MCKVDPGRDIYHLEWCDYAADQQLHFVERIVFIHSSRFLLKAAAVVGIELG